MLTYLAALQAELEAAGYVFLKDPHGVWMVLDGKVDAFPNLRWSMLADAITFTARAVGLK